MVVPLADRERRMTMLFYLVILRSILSSWRELALSTGHHLSPQFFKTHDSTLYSVYDVGGSRKFPVLPVLKLPDQKIPALVLTLEVPLEIALGVATNAFDREKLVCASSHLLNFVNLYSFVFIGSDNSMGDFWGVFCSWSARVTTILRVSVQKIIVTRADGWCAKSFRWWHEPMGMAADGINSCLYRSFFILLLILTILFCTDQHFLNVDKKETSQEAMLERTNYFEQHSVEDKSYLITTTAKLLQNSWQLIGRCNK